MTIILKCLFLALIAFAPCAIISISHGYDSANELLFMYSCVFLVCLALNLVDVIIDYSPKTTKEILRFANDQLMIAFFFGTIIYFLVNYIDPSFQLKYWLAVVATLACSLFQSYLVKK